MSVNHEEITKIAELIENLTKRELDVFVAKYFYEIEVIAENVKSKNQNNIRYLIPRQTKRLYRSYFSKNKSKLEKENAESYQPLPRYAYDVKDSFKLLNAAVKRFGKAEINIDKNNNYIIRMGYFETAGTFGEAVVKNALMNKFYVMEKNNNA